MTKEIQEMNAALDPVAADNLVRMIDFPGLDGIPTSDIPVPKIKLVQSNSQDVLISDGSEARKGSFYYTDRQASEDSIKAAILYAQHLTYTGPSIDDPNRIETKHSRGLILLDLALSEVYILRFQPGSFANWRALVGQMLAARKAGDMTTSFSRATNITSELVKGDNRSWYALRFNIGEKLDDVTFDTAATLHEQYRGYFNATASNEETE